ncbi:MAG: hypothetical protein GY816_01460 [Cytophagales bacterium]|nr:hypothetical protein [Cytophagales bacterium]
MRRRLKKFPNSSSFFLSLVIFLFVLACRPDEELISKSPGLKLIISQDTVLFDTLLTSRGSITRRFRIFNPNKAAIKFSRITLGKGNSSDYSLTINGRETDELRDEILFGNDSLQILVSVFIDPQDQNLPYLVKDSVVFDWNGNSGNVKLVAYGQDAVFVNGETLCDVTWTADRPYVIYNYALVDTLCTLTVDPGAQIFLYNGAGLFVKGSLKMLGTKDERITVKNTRFDARYQQAPGQWDAIYFLEGSKANEVNYADISNGSIGLRIGTPDEDNIYDVVINNSTIQHMDSLGILAITSDVKVENTLIYNCGQYLIGNFAGGNYSYDHCTLVNEPNFFFREDESVVFSDNLVLADNSLLVSDLNLKIRNTIIWGSEEEELLISESGQSVVTKTFETSMVKSVIGFNNFFPSQESNFPGFTNPFLFDYTLDSLSNARDKGSDIGISIDLLGIPRDLNPDLGAYERVDD